MSSHNFVSSSSGGAGTETGRDENRSAAPPPRFYTQAQPQQHILQTSDGKTSFQTTKVSMANRPIAPAPGPGSTHLAGPVATATPHNIVTNVAKVPTALMSGSVEVANTAAVNMSALQHAAAVATSTHQLSAPVGLQTSATSIVQATGMPITHQVKLPVSMASLIRGVTLPQAANQQFSGGQTHPVVTATGAHGIHQQHTTPIVHAFQSHVPRGAVAASALAAPKSSAVATAVLRPTTPTSVQLTTVPASTTPNVSAIHQIHAQPRALLPVQTASPTTPQVNRSSSPQIALPVSDHRPVSTFRNVAGHPNANNSATVQITIQQPRTGAPLLSQLSQQPKPVPLSQPVVAGAQVVPSKLAMSQATVAPIIHPSTANTQKIATHSQAGYLSQVIPRPQKLIMSQTTAGSVLQTTNVQTITPTPKAVGLTVGGPLAKAPKIVVTQAAPLSTIQNALPVSLTAHPAMEQSLRVLSGSAGATLNLTQANLRQKVTMSQVTLPSTVHAAVNIAAQPKTVTQAMSLTASSHALASVPGISALSTASMSTPTVTTVTTIPIAKVQPQRQLPPTQIQQLPQQSQAPQSQAITPAQQPQLQATPQPQQHPQTQQSQQQQQPQITHHAGHEFTTQREPAPGPATAMTCSTTLPQGSIYLPQSHRCSPNTGTAPTTAINVATTHTEARPAEGQTGLRTGFPHIPYTTALPPEYQNAYNYASIVNYQNLLYQGHPQATFTSIPGTTSIRPGIVPTQGPSLAATLQATAHGVTVSSAQGVRLNPINVMTVDPNRHPSLVHAQYTPTTEVSAPGSESNAAITTASGILSTTAPVQTSGTPSQPPVINNPSASPRPSILRKRTNDGSVAMVKKNLMAMGMEASSPSGDGGHHPTPAISPKPTVSVDLSHENSQSSTDTATSTESPPQSVPTPELRIKQEPMDTAENGLTPSGIPPATPATVPNSVEASPRKKPRKQLLNANEELKDGTSTDDDEKLTSATDVKPEVDKNVAVKKEAEEYVDDEGVRWVVERKRPNISLLTHYQCTWKAKNNHFLKHSDVKPKEERRPTVNELANQKSVVQKASGWKLYHLAAQLEEMMDLERDVFSKMGQVQEAIAPKHIAKHTMEDDIGMIHELTQGNIQRCQLVMDQLEEARSSMVKILDHKQRIMEIISKHHSKRPVKKKERT